MTGRVVRVVFVLMIYPLLAHIPRPCHSDILNHIMSLMAVLCPEADQP